MVEPQRADLHLHGTIKRKRAHSQWPAGRMPVFFAQQDVSVAMPGAQHKHAKPIAIEPELIGHDLHHAEEGHEHAPDGEWTGRMLSGMFLCP